MLNLIVIALYIGAMLGIGWYAKRRTRNEEEFLVAGRRLGPFLYAGTMAAVAFGRPLRWAPPSAPPPGSDADAAARAKAQAAVAASNDPGRLRLLLARKAQRHRHGGQRRQGLPEQAALDDQPLTGPRSQAPSG